jgi:hypothetical protein
MTFVNMHMKYFDHIHCAPLSHLLHLSAAPPPHISLSAFLFNLDLCMRENILYLTFGVCLTALSLMI